MLYLGFPDLFDSIVLYINVQALLEAEPELSEVHEDLLCPVCLDILHEPFKVDPCRDQRDLVQMLMSMLLLILLMLLTKLILRTLRKCRL